MRALRRGGDALDTPWFEEGSHGSPGLRFDAFLYGFEEHDCTSDAFFEFLKVRGIDPSRIQQTVAPQSGALAKLVKPQVGRFTLAGTQRVEVLTATDAISADYKAADGVTVAHGVAVFGTPDAASERFDGAVGAVKAKGYTEIKREDVVNTKQEKIGTLVVLQGNTEIIFWTNRQYLAVIEAPRDISWEFYNALPY